MNPRYNVGTNSIPKFPRFVKMIVHVYSSSEWMLNVSFSRFPFVLVFSKIRNVSHSKLSIQCDFPSTTCISVFFSAFNMVGWCWMAIPKPFLRATRWCGTIRPPCRSCNTSPRRQLSKSSDAQKNWAIALQAWTMMPRNKHVSFFQVVSFFEHGMGFTTCTPKIVLLRC